MKKMLFILLLTANYINAQNYGDKFLPLIIEGSKEHLIKYSTYRRFVDSVEVDLRHKKIIANKSTLPLIYIDSLTNNYNANFFFDDNIFHLKGNILLIDTLYFFSQNCFKSDKINIIIHRDLNYRYYKSKDIIADTVILKYVSASKNGFSIALQHTQSDYLVQFYFRLSPNFPIKIVDIFRHYSADENKYRWDEFLEDNK